MNPLGSCFPEIDADRCVHALAPFASCRACVEICPTGAWLLDEEGLALATDRCTSCGQCVPACPREALQMPRPMAILSRAKDQSDAFAACQRSGVPGATLACVHAIGLRDLDRMADDGINSLTIATGACATCDRAPKGPDLEGAAARHARLRASRRQPVTTLRRLDADAYSRALARAKEDVDRGDRSRRRLFSAFVDRPPAVVATVPPEPAEPRAALRPQIDSARCVACDACIRACPDGAMLSVATETGPAYVIEPLACTGCRLCIDVCDQHAVSLDRDGLAASQQIGLDPYRCRACGVRYYALSGVAAPDAGGLCRICARTGHFKKLYQVFKDA